MRVTIPGVPTANQFTTLAPTIEILEIDNTANTQPIAWTQRSGLIEARTIPNSGPAIPVIGTDGVDLTRILGGTADDTLEVVNETAYDTPGFIDGNRVELTTGLRVVIPNGSPLTRLPNYDQVISFDLAPSGLYYDEDGYSLTTEQLTARPASNEETTNKPSNPRRKRKLSDRQFRRFFGGASRLRVYQANR